MMWALALGVALAQEPEPPVATEPAQATQPAGHVFDGRSYANGYQAGRVDAGAGVDARPFAVGAGVALVTTGLTTFLIGPCIGAPLIAAGCLGPALGYQFARVSPPEQVELPALSAEEQADWLAGYNKGYAFERSHRRSRNATVGVVLGGVVGATVGLSASTVLLQRWGYL